MNLKRFNPNSPLIDFQDGTILINNYGNFSVLLPSGETTCFSSSVLLPNGNLIKINQLESKNFYQEFFKTPDGWEEKTSVRNLTIQAIDQYFYVGNEIDFDRYIFPYTIYGPNIPDNQIYINLSGSSIIPSISGCSPFSYESVSIITGSVFYKNLIYIEDFETGSFDDFILDIDSYAPQFYSSLLSNSVQNGQPTSSSFFSQFFWNTGSLDIIQMTIRSSGPQDDDVRIKIDGVPVKDDRRNVGWYSGSITLFPSSSNNNWPTSGFFEYSLNKSEFSGSYMAYGKLVEVDLFDGWAAVWRISPVQVTMSFNDGTVTQFQIGTPTTGSSVGTNPPTNPFTTGPHFISYYPIGSFLIEK